MIPFTDRSVEKVFDSYPEEVQPAMWALRDLVFTTAGKIGIENELKETLKWGEPGYQCKTGSTIRIHWKEDDPEHYRMFFHCQTSLVPTFRELYPDSFEFEGNRAIRIALKDEPNLIKLGHCIELSLKYHLLKNLPCLGVRTESGG